MLPDPHPELITVLWSVPLIGRKYSDAVEACLAKTAVHCMVELFALIYQL